MFLNFKLLSGVVSVAIFLGLLWPSEAEIDIQRVGVLQVMGEKQYFVQKVAKVNFYSAIQYCAALDMSLVSIESETEQQNLKILLLMNSLLSRQYWLSGNDLPLSREFVWFGTGNLFSYTSWATGVRVNNNQRCVRTDANFNWRRDYCNYEQYFICERPVKPACGENGQCLQRESGSD